MDASIVTAAAGLTGAAIGGFTSVLASWLSQRYQERRSGSSRSNSSDKEYTKNSSMMLRSYTSMRFSLTKQTFPP